MQTGYLQRVDKRSLPEPEGNLLCNILPTLKKVQEHGCTMFHGTIDTEDPKWKTVSGDYKLVSKFADTREFTILQLKENLEKEKQAKIEQQAKEREEKILKLRRDIEIEKIRKQIQAEERNKMEEEKRKLEEAQRLIQEERRRIQEEEKIKKEILREQKKIQLQEEIEERRLKNLILEETKRAEKEQKKEEMREKIEEMKLIQQLKEQMREEKRKIQKQLVLEQIAEARRVKEDNLKARELKKEIEKMKRDERRAKYEAEIAELNLVLAVKREVADLEKKKKLVGELNNLNRRDYFENMDRENLPPVWTCNKWGEVIHGQVQKYHLGGGHVLEYESQALCSIRVMKKPLDLGTFRVAFYCYYNSKPCIAKIHLSTDDVEGKCKLDMKTTMVSESYAKQFNNCRPTGTKPVKFADVVMFKPTNPWFESEYILIEDLLPGKFTKFNNNGAYVNTLQRSGTAQAFSHFTFSKSKGTEMVTDIQGCEHPKNEYLLTDPAIHSTAKHFGSSDCGKSGMDEFFKNHQCNKICRDMGLVKSALQTKPDDMMGTVART